VIKEGFKVLPFAKDAEKIAIHLIDTIWSERIYPAGFEPLKKLLTIIKKAKYEEEEGQATANAVYPPLMLAIFAAEVICTVSYYAPNYYEAYECISWMAADLIDELDEWQEVDGDDYSMYIEQIKNIIQ